MHEWHDLINSPIQSLSVLSVEQPLVQILLYSFTSPTAHCPWLKTFPPVLTSQIQLPSAAPDSSNSSHRGRLPAARTARRGTAPMASGPPHVPFNSPPTWSLTQITLSISSPGTSTPMSRRPSPHSWSTLTTTTPLCSLSTRWIQSGTAQISPCRCVVDSKSFPVAE